MPNASSRNGSRQRRSLVVRFPSHAGGYDSHDLFRHGGVSENNSVRISKRHAEFEVVQFAA